MADKPPTVPQRTTSMLSRWPHANLTPNSQGQVSLPQGSQIPLAVTPVTRSGSEYPPLPPEIRPRRPPKQRAIVTPLDSRLVASPSKGAVVATSAKVDDGQVSIHQQEDTGIGQPLTDADKVSISPQQTPLQLTCVELQSRTNPYENSVQSQRNPNGASVFDQSVQTRGETCCAEVQTDAELQSQRNPNEAVGFCQGVQARVQTCCAEVQTDHVDAIAAAARMPPAELTVPSVPTVLSVPSVHYGDSSAASSVGGGQATSRIPLRIQASQSSGSTASTRSNELPRSAEASSEFSVDSIDDNSQPSRHEVHHHHHHYHHTHSYSFCTVIQHNTNRPDGQIGEVEEQQYEDS